MKSTSKNNNLTNYKKINTCCQFVTKLMQMMKQYGNNVKWSADGNYICFEGSKIVQNQVIPSYFRHHNMLSFVRQLNMYNFSKIEISENDQMKFKHDIFKKGNQHNFHLITRRNKQRDQIIISVQKNYAQILNILQQQQNISQQAKSLIRICIQYHSIVLKNLKKIKSSIQQLSQHLKTVRSPQIKTVLTKLKDQNMTTLIQLIQQQKSMDIFIKQKLCRDEKHKLQQKNILNNQILQSYASQAILFDQPRTIKDAEMNRVLSFINFKSDCSLGMDLQEHGGEQNNKNQDISLGEGLEDQQFQRLLFFGRIIE